MLLKSIPKGLRNPFLTTRFHRLSLRGVKTTSGKQVITLIPGDGVGPEICDSAVGILQAAGTPIEFERFDVPQLNESRFNQADILPTELIASVSRNAVALKGPFWTPLGSKGYIRNLEMRRVFDLHTMVVPCYTYPGVRTRHSDVNLVVIRENTEGEYSGLEQKIIPGVVQSLKVITAKKSTKLAHYAFQYAVKYGRKKITAVHKANIQKITDGLFLESFRTVAKQYPEISYNEMIVDNTCMQLVLNPTQFDVMATPNLYGNVVTNVAAGIVGGPGLTPGANIGDRIAVFEPGTRHTGMDIAGSNLANPTAMILSSVMMLRHLGLDIFADKIDRALSQVISEGKHLTHDFGGNTSTSDFTCAVIEALEGLKLSV
eukprot:TRINITY_DN4102_c0_g1_i1.p1 TRINITY_DN4102_c0_g1~~TRINITY_DN4102_c0_g1_i1.p1  ORF type:complete len:374 (+),score=65.45 TRINITY_DN4102_c0_g1_i1:68-1189(+)